MSSRVTLNQRYRLDEEIGHGAMGTVWRGFDLLLHRLVAVKILRDTGVHDAEMLARFMREGRAAAQLDHPAIETVHDVGSDTGDFFLVLELLRGEDLGQVLATSHGVLPVATVLGYGIEIADGLAAAHAAGVIHRDIKPSNLMLLPDGRVKICDFGIAHLLEATGRLTGTDRAIGTPAYMAPEQWVGRQIDGRADLYSLGCVLYELLTGLRPFQAGHPPAALPDDLGSYLLRLLAEDPRHRPPSAMAVAAELRGISSRYQAAEQARNERISSLLADAEQIARTADYDWDKAELLRLIAETITLRDPARSRSLLAEAERIARSLSDGSAQWELRRTAAVMALLDPVAAIQIICSFGSINDQIGQLVRTAGKTAAADPDVTRRLLAAAEQIAVGVPKPLHRSNYLTDIARALTPIDPGRAQDLLTAAGHAAREASSEREQSDGLWRAAEVMADLDTSCARDLLAEADRAASGITDPADQPRIRGYIAEAMARLDPDQAERIARAIADPEEQLDAMQNVAQLIWGEFPVKARQLLADAERIAHSLAPYQKSRQLRHLAKAAAPLDANLAARIARSNTDPWSASRGLLEAGKATASREPAKARRLLDEARSIDPEHNLEQEVELLGLLAETAAAHDADASHSLLAEAGRAIAQASDPWDQDHGRQALARATANIASSILRRDRAQAESVARDIAVADVRDRALRDMAIVIAGSDQARGVRIIQDLAPGEFRDDAAAQVIAVIAHKDPGHAEQIARTVKFTDPPHQAKALIAIADALARPDHSQ